MNPGYGGGFGRRGWGGGRGWRNWFHLTGLTGWQRAFGWPAPRAPQEFAAPTQDRQIDALKAQAEHFQGALEEIRKQIEALKAAPRQE